MRTLWNVVSFLAVVHLLAILMFIGWLWQSQRLSGERVQGVRALFSRTIAEQERDEAEAGAAAQAELRRDRERERRANPAMDSPAQIRHVSLVREQEAHALRRLEDEKNVLLKQLADSAAALDRQSRQLEQQRQEWETAVHDERRRKTDEQFMQTVRQYEQVPPRQGKSMIMQLVGQGQTSIAVSYLDAMSPRAAAKILREFKTGDELVLATELLERLRSFGVGDSSRHEPVSPAPVERPSPMEGQARLAPAKAEASDDTDPVRANPSAVSARR
jgi:hypothetical protein